jgi:ribonuclease Z
MVGAVSNRELVVLGTASQAPTRRRNHNGYLLRWDAEGVLFDPGEGTQRQMLFAGVTASHISRICITHFHGDHCLGLPGVIQRMSLDQVPNPVQICYPAENTDIYERLRHAALFRESAQVVDRPVDSNGEVGGEVGGPGTCRLEARRLSHTVPTFGYALTEPDGRRMLPDKLAAAGVSGPDVGRLQRDGRLIVRNASAGGNAGVGRSAGAGGNAGVGRSAGAGGNAGVGRSASAGGNTGVASSAGVGGSPVAAGDRVVTLEQVSEPRAGQRFAFIMDTGLCDAAFALAERADMVVCESTFADADAALAREYRHLTAGQAGRIAAESGARLLVLTHFSQRYDDEAVERLAGEAAMAFGGLVILAGDLDRIPVPRRR